MAKGYTQTYNADYVETLSPIALIVSICILVSLAVTFGWPFFQVVVKNAFFHEELQDEVYMEKFPAFCCQGEGKQTSQGWYKIIP